jgi:hypothetical protein
MHSADGVQFQSSTRMELLVHSVPVMDQERVFSTSAAVFTALTIATILNVFNHRDSA